MLKTRIEGLDQTKRKLKGIPKAIDKGAGRAVEDETRAVAADMRNNAPVDEGELVDGIQVRVTGREGRAVSTAGHSNYVEHGTSSAPAQPFAGPAAARARQRYPKRMREDVHDELKRIK